ncbi:uncharacterized protein [Penaeus vannamei]|uniref:Uncharacterized protein n=1 Tax=Penaeus vannamei TaxID=6689 RepID=A0A423TL54_PENVA|nr:uncharacterized protein LOC113804722 [Penaeus vannamei]ROT77173.1 hypothetical protein C7M84_004202 [Penaeus vannamei]
MRAGVACRGAVAFGLVALLAGRGSGFVSSLPEAGERILALQEKLVKFAEGGDSRRREGGAGDFSNMWTQWHKDASHLMLKLKTPGDKLMAIRGKLLDKIMVESKQLTSNNQSIVSIAFLAFGVILFDVLGDALFGTSSNILASLGGGLQGRETLLPGLGLFGDNVNNLAEVVLNMITIYLYRDESPDCGERLLCESNQQAVSRGFLDTLVTYISGFAVSFFLHEAPLSRNLQAMRAGRKGQNCIEIYPRCSITL